MKDWLNKQMGGATLSEVLEKVCEVMDKVLLRLDKLEEYVLRNEDDGK